MAERTRFIPSKETLRRRLPAIIVAPLIAGCGTSVADLDSDAPPPLHSETIKFYCAPEQAGIETVQNVSYYADKGEPFAIRVVDARIEEEQKRRSTGIPIQVYPDSLMLNRGTRDLAQTVLVTLKNVRVEAKATPNEVELKGTCLPK
jgi:hypothetical protein